MTSLGKIVRSRPFKIYASLVILLLVLAGTRLAHDYLERRVVFEPRWLTDTEYQALMDRMEQFKQAYATGDAATLANMLPPGYLEQGAARVERQPEWVRGRYRASAEQLFKDIQVNRVHFYPNIARSGAGRGELVLAQIETHIDFNSGKGDRIMRYPVIAIRDDTEWWVLHLTSRPMREVLLEAYPDIQGLNDRPLHTVN